MSKLPAIELGEYRGGPKDGKPFKVELELLMEQNLLLQANSGGGKSWALRRLIEQAYGKLPVIIIDPEGEFSTLRAKFDFLLVGQGGETPADVRSARLLAHRLLEFRVNAVCNLFDLAPAARVAWVAAFVEAIVDSPKKLWGDVAIMIDEAHDFAPEKGHGRVSEAAAAATNALASLASKGRKRGMLTVAATQRLGKLNKDFAAELKTVLIGQTWIDIDRERAAEALGIAKAGKAAFFEQIKAIEPGHFFALGRAVAKEPTHIQTGPVQSEHPTRGERQAAPPPPTAKILHLLPQLGDLPKQAEEKAKTEAEMKGEIARLRRELAAAKSRPDVTVHIEERLPAAVHKSIVSMGDNLARVLSEAGQLSKAYMDLENVVSASAARAASAKPAPARPVENPLFIRAHTNGVRKAAPRAEGDLSKCQRAILTALAQMDGRANDPQISILSGYSVNSSGFDNAKGSLRTAGLIEYQGDDRLLTDAGRAAAGDVPPAPSGDDLFRFWHGKLSKCEAAILQALWHAGPLTKEELAKASSYSITSSGFDNGLGALRSARLITPSRVEPIALAESFR